MILAALALAAAPTPATAPQSRIPRRTESTMIYGLQPPPSCGNWTAERKQRSGRAVQMESWVMGFLTALNLYVPATGGDIAKSADVEGFYGWLDKYCGDHPLDTFVGAVMTLADELHTRRR